MSEHDWDDVLPTFAYDPGEWEADGLCRQVDMDLFFPERGQTPQANQAKAICRQCPVMATCRQKSIERHERFGVWGGLTYHERRKLPEFKATSAA